MIRMRPRFGRVKKKDPAELVRFRLKMVQLFSDTIALLKDEGDHELAEELRKTKNYTAHNPAQSRGRARREAARPEEAEEAVNDRIAAARRCGIGSNYVVGDGATETVTTAFSIEPEQMVAIGVRLDVPELPDETAFNKDRMHQGLRTYVRVCGSLSASP